MNPPAFPNGKTSRSRNHYVDRDATFTSGSLGGAIHLPSGSMLIDIKLLDWDYVRYKGDPTRFNNDSSAALSFDCERIRDDFVKLTQSIISPELSTSAETIVAEGSTLHLGDPSVSGSESICGVEEPSNQSSYDPAPKRSGPLRDCPANSIYIYQATRTQCG